MSSRGSRCSGRKAGFAAQVVGSRADGADELGASCFEASVEWAHGPMLSQDVPTGQGKIASPSHLRSRFWPAAYRIIPEARPMAAFLARDEFG